MGTRRAFTLIELLIVVALIGLLMAILLPSLGAARNSARRTACASNLRQIGVAMRTYLGWSNDRYPYASAMPSITGAFPLDGNDPVYIADVLTTDTNCQSKVFQCPNDQGTIDRGAPNFSKTYFQTEHSSYEYRVRLAGETIEEYARRYEDHQAHDGTFEKVRKNSVWIFRDFNNFHAQAGKPGARRYLYGDGHVTDFEVDH